MCTEESREIPSRYDFLRSFKKPYFLEDNNVIPHFSMVGGTQARRPPGATQPFSPAPTPPMPNDTALWSLASSGPTDVIPSPDYIRLVPGIRSKQGAVWSQLPVEYENWSVEFKFFITGRSVPTNSDLASRACS